MKIINYLFVLVIVISFSCKKSPLPPVKSDVDLTKGLLLYLPFNGSLADSSGNNNRTTFTGGNGSPLVTDQNGKANSAFFGDGGRLLVTNNGSINFDTAYTISFNYLVMQSGYQAFLSMVNPVTGKGPSFILGTNIEESPYFDFSGLVNLANCDDYGIAAVTNNNFTQYIPQTGIWYNAICVFHGAENSVFINGKLSSRTIFSSPVTGALLCSDAEFIVGGWWNSDPLPFNGKLDEVRLYNRTLNTDEINALSKSFH